MTFAFSISTQYHTPDGALLKVWVELTSSQDHIEKEALYDFVSNAFHMTTLMRQEPTESIRGGLRKLDRIEQDLKNKMSIIDFKITFSAVASSIDSLYARLN